MCSYLPVSEKLATQIQKRLSRVYMELIGSLTRDIRSLCVVIYLFQKS